MEDGVQQYVNTAKVLKNMQKYLGNPQTIKELHNALKAMPSEEFYDLHEEELGEVFHMYMELGRKPDLETNDDRMRYKIGRMMDVKRDIEEITKRLFLALKDYSAPDYFTEEEQDKKLLFEKQIKMLFANILECFDVYKKQISVDDIYKLKHDVMQRLNHVNVKTINNAEIAYVLSLLLQCHIYVGKDDIDKAFQHLMAIHGEDISKPLLGGANLSGDYKGYSLLFMQYGFGQIAIDELLEGIKPIIKRNNETIQSYIQPAIPLYGRLRTVLQKTNDEEEKSEQLVPLDASTDITNIGKNIDVKTIADKSYENDCLKVILKTDKALLEQKLQPLKKICDMSRIDTPALEA